MTTGRFHAPHDRLAGPERRRVVAQKIRPAIPGAVAKAFRDFDREARRRWPKTEYHFPREDR
jgi:hypothetical protein